MSKKSNAHEYVDRFKKMNWNHEYAENGIVSVADAEKIAKLYARQEVKKERNKIKKRLMKWANKEKDHDQLLYPWIHI